MSTSQIWKSNPMNIPNIIKTVASWPHVAASQPIDIGGQLTMAASHPAFYNIGSSASQRVDPHINNSLHNIIQT